MWCIAPLSDEKRVFVRRSAHSERLDLRGKQCTAPVSGLCLDVEWMFGIEGWIEGFDLLRISLGRSFRKLNASAFLWKEFPCLNAPFAFMKLCFAKLGSESQEL